MCPSSPAWGHGLWHGTLAPMAMGVEIASYAGRFDAKTLFNAIQEMGITNLSAAATHYRMMKNAGCGPADDSRIEKLSFTGEPIDSDTETWVEQTFGVLVCSIYGTTEVGVVLASYPGATDFDVRPGTLGKPVPGVVLDIHDANGQSCAADQVGEIMLKRRDGWFSIKDLGHRDEDGYWWHDGRADDVIIPAGPTGLYPKQTSFFQALSITTKIVKGQVEIVNPVQVITDGEKIGGSQAALLDKLKIRPFEYKMHIKMILDNGKLFPPKILSIDEEAILSAFTFGANNMTSLSLGSGYVVPSAAPHLVLNAFKNLAAVSFATDYSFPQAEKLRAAAASMPASSGAAAATTAAAPKEEAVVEEEPEEDVDMGDLFGGDY